MKADCILLGSDVVPLKSPALELIKWFAFLRVIFSTRKYDSHNETKVVRKQSLMSWQVQHIRNP